MRRANLIVLAGISLVAGGIGAAGISRIRDAASRSSCVNHLKQTGLAVQNFGDAKNQLPGATVLLDEDAASTPDVRPELRLSWFVDILPYIEAAPWPPYDKTKPWDSEENRPRSFLFHLYKTDASPLVEGYWGHHRNFLCPAANYKPVLGSFSVSHYVGISGLGRDAITRPADAAGVGFFGYDRVLRWNEIQHPASNMLMVLETAHANGPWVASGFPTVRGIDPDGGAYLGEGGQFGGLHRGGANALFVDGSVRFLSNQTDRSIIETMSSITRRKPETPGEAPTPLGSLRP